MEYASNASKLHISFGELLEAIGFGNYNVQQEVQVQSICPSHDSPKDAYDYFLPELSLIVELHGQQHYKPATFGGISKREATRNYGRRVMRDNAKAESAFRHNFLYIAFAYNEPMTQEVFYEKLQDARVHLEEFQLTFSSEETKSTLSEFDKQVKKQQEKTREYWRKRRQELKDQE